MDGRKASDNLEPNQGDAIVLRARHNFTDRFQTELPRRGWAHL